MLSERNRNLAKLKAAHLRRMKAIDDLRRQEREDKPKPRNILLERIAAVQKSEAAR